MPYSEKLLEKLDLNETDIEAGGCTLPHLFLKKLNPTPELQILNPETYPLNPEP